MGSANGNALAAPSHSCQWWDDQWPRDKPLARQGHPFGPDKNGYVADAALAPHSDSSVEEGDGFGRFARTAGATKATCSS